jgi:hypothetical protein
MAPARPRATVDDSRSETSSVIASLKERAKNGSGFSKNKKKTANLANDSNSVYQAAVSGAQAAANALSNGAVDVDPGIPQVSNS